VAFATSLEEAVQTHGLVNPKRRMSARHENGILSLATLLAMTVFYLDTFTDIHSALATLYVITVLLSAETLTEKGTLLLSAVCGSLAIFSYLTAHGLQADLAATLRLVVALAALAITCALVIRNQRARLDLLRFNADLRRSEERYRTLFEQGRVALWERDYSDVREMLMQLRTDGVRDLRAYARDHPDFIETCIARVPTIAANAAALELLGNVDAADVRAIRRYIAQDDATFLELLVAIFEERRHFEGRGTVITADGSSKLVLLTVGFPEDAADFNRVVVGMFDITEREAAQKALFDAQAELARASRAATIGALSASLAHELNQPLGAVVVNAQTLQRWLDRDPPDLAAVSRSAERIVRDSRRASDIIQSTRSMLGNRAPEFDPVSLPDLVLETRTLLESDLLRGRTVLEVDAKEAIPLVRAVRIELQQVLINLITNALHAMATTPEAERRIRVTIEAADDVGAMIRVRDTGPGLSEEVFKTLFKPFCTTKETGLGIGLAICRSMLEARGGTLTASNHPGAGAQFEMTIPIEAHHD
jgi:C4-dicarboxylate-specific signal transduction histidine kinase